MIHHGRPSLVSNRRALFRITESARRDLEKLVFSRHPDREWGSFCWFGYRKTPWGLALSYASPLPPNPGDLRRDSGIVSFNPDYIDRAVDELADSRLALGVVHSHPAGCAVFPSGLDDDMDNHFGREMFPPFAPDRPYASLIVNRSADGALEFSGRVLFEGEWLPVSTIYSAGEALVRIESSISAQKPPPLTEDTLRVLKRWLGLVDRASVDRLRRSVVGIVGCSGTGSPAIEVLARAQIGEFVLVDPDRLSYSNIERVHGSKISDLKVHPPPYKVQIMARMIREVNPSAKITIIAGSSLDPICIDELLRCDLIFGCTDSNNGRAHLGDLASRYLVPVIDVGVLPDGEGGRISQQMTEIMRLSPDDACPFCHGRIDAAALSAEIMSLEEIEEAEFQAEEAKNRGDDPDPYWQGRPAQLPSVGYHTTLGGALAGGYGLNWILQTAEMPHSRFQFDHGAKGFGFCPAESAANPDCGCERFKGHSDQAELSITKPKHLQPAEIVSELAPEISKGWIARAFGWLKSIWRK
ncbi:MAG: ThiF family adenylyltransferase [Verrucomicrobiota bacterium]